MIINGNHFSPVSGQSSVSGTCNAQTRQTTGGQLKDDI